MRHRLYHLAWVPLLAAFLYATAQLIASDLPGPRASIGVVIISIFVLTCTALLLSPFPQRAWLLVPPRAFRQRFFFFWLGCLLAVFAIITRLMMYNTDEWVDYLFWALLLALAYLLLLGLSPTEWDALRAQIATSRASGFLLSLGTIFAVLVIIELGLRNFLVLSNNYSLTPMHQRWYQRYWHPINELGYRDYPPATDAPADTTRILIMGDSFTAGAGIADVNDTFPQQLKQRLGAGYTVNIAAEPGWATLQQFEAAQNYPFVPNILVLSYVLNDISSADPQYGRRLREAFSPPTPPLSYLTNNFDIASIFYWHVYREATKAPEDVGDVRIQISYQDPAVWARQEKLFSQIIEWAEANNSHLIALVWPSMNDVNFTQPETTRVTQFFAERGVPVHNLTEDLRPYDVLERRANPFDSHPSALAHSIAADALAKMIR